MGTMMVVAGSNEGAKIEPLALAELGRIIAADATEALEASWDLKNSMC
jgi:hypothetical protein